MAFIALKCPACGADISLDDSRDFGFCQYCGTKIVQDKTIIEHRGSVSIDHTNEIGNLLILGKRLFNQNRFTEAESYFRKVLELDAHNSEALKCLNISERVITSPNFFIERLPSKTFDNSVAMQIIVDGAKVGKIRTGETVSLKVPAGEHDITFHAPMYANNPPAKFTIFNKYSKYKLVFKAKIFGRIDSHFE